MVLTERAETGANGVNQEAKTRQQIERSVGVIDDILSPNIQDANSKCEIFVRLETIIKIL